LNPDGRRVLERLVTGHGADREAILGELRSGWSGEGETPIGESQLQALLDHHGLAPTFARRERERLRQRELVGQQTRARVAAGALGPATLAQRARQLLAEEGQLAELGVLDPVIADLKARLPDHLTALRSSRPRSLREALAQSLSIPPAALERLLARLQIDLH
jgi:hypothetical protein